VIFKIFLFLSIALLISSCSHDQLTFENSDISIDIATYGGQPTVSMIHEINCHDKVSDVSFSKNIEFGLRLSGIKFDGEKIYSIYFGGFDAPKFEINIETHEINKCSDNQRSVR
jgi:hypothetical protein